MSVRLQQAMVELLQASTIPPKTAPLSVRPWIIIFLGVNGVGKTTTIAKLAAQYRSAGKKVLLGAADTYRGIDVLLIDTAGRLHTKVHLIEELKKIRRVISREQSDAPHETLLVLDATTGQNGLQQARVFKEATDITGIVLTKLDGTAKGGVIVSIQEELGVPVRYVGVGEDVEDLQPFDASEFVRALFEK